MGGSFPSRVAASLLNAIDLPCLITDNKESYEALAIELANNAEKLANIKERLAVAEHKSTLFNTPLFAKDIEGAYIQMYEGYHAD
jgi:predicted O-linked N-acetylglucosamine transferase (SPINDLY family)